MNLGQFDPENIANTVSGGWWNTLKGWIAPLTLIGGGLVALGFITQDKADSFGDTVKGWLSSLKDMAFGLFDGGEAANVRKGLTAQLDRATSFSSIDALVGVKGLGNEIRTLCKEAAAEGGEPIDNAIGLHGKIVETITGKLPQIKSNWQKADRDALVAKANAIAFQVTGLESTTKEDNNPATLTTGYVGMRLKTQKAKEAEGTLQESEVAPITINTAALQQAVREASAAVSSGVTTDGAATPPKRTGQRETGL